MKKLMAVMLSLFFTVATVSMAAAEGKPASEGLKKGIAKHHKHKHPINKGLEESTEKGANGMENSKGKNATGVAESTEKGMNGTENGGK